MARERAVALGGSACGRAPQGDGLSEASGHPPLSYFFFRAWRLARMNLVVDLFLRVFFPLVGKPHGVTGCRPPEVRPSPPPCGWSIGFIATPRLCGRRPSQRERPALPIEMFMWSGFDTAPTVAKHWPWTKRCSPELRRRMT